MMRHEIVVAGGGLVGAALTLALLQQGFDAVLVERAPPPPAFNPHQDDLRVYAISPGSMRWLDALGAWARVRNTRCAAYRRMQVWSEAPDQSLVFDAGDIRRAELGWIVENSLLQDALWRQLPASACRTGCEVEGLELDEAGAVLRLRDGRALQTGLLIAADGAESRLRDWAGIETLSWPYPQRAIVANVRTERGHGDSAWQRFLPSGPLAFLPLADGRSSIVWSSRDAEQLLALDDEGFRAELSAASQYALGDVLEIGPRASFPLRLAHAETYVKDRFALVGDSAHSVHPLAGQGVNLGLADAEALVNILAAARAAGRDYGSVRNLKRYERARRAHNLDMLAVTDGLSRAFQLDMPGWSGLRDTGMLLVQRWQPLKALLARQATGS